MKQILIILGLFASVTTFAQSPRIKLNQITKDTVKGSVLISSPSDSGMVYSRDFYIAYGADTVLILYGDTLAATSDIISSVLSDGVTITGNGTSGNELKVDTSLIATIKALNDSLATISASTTPDGVTITGDGSVGNPLKVDTLLIATIKALNDSLATISASTTPDGVTITGDGSVGNPLKVDTLLIATIKALNDTLTARGYLTANETITLSGDVTGSGKTAITATVVDDSHNHIISNVDFLQDSLTAKANASELSNYLLTSNYIVDSTRINATGDTAYYYQNGVLIGTGAIAGGIGIGSGTVTSITAGTYLSGGTITTSGTIALDTASAGLKTYISENIGTVDLASEVTGTLPVANGGTGATTLTSGAFLKGNGTSAVSGSSNLTETADTVFIDKYLNVDTSTLYVDASNNRVGIGTTSPNEKLDVRGRIEIQEQTDPSTAGSGLGTIYANSSNSKLYYRDDNGNNYDLTSTATTSDSSWTNSGTVTYLTDSGDKVGIGTSSPTTKLDLVNTSAFDGFRLRNLDESGYLTFTTFLNAPFFTPGVLARSNNSSYSAFRIRALVDSLAKGVEMQIANSTNSGDAPSNAIALQVRNWSTELMRVEGDGGIFAPSLLNASTANTMYYNTTTDEISYSSSSIRFKNDIEDLPIGLNELMMLKPTRYTYIPDGKKDYGFIAEQVYDVGLTEFVTFNQDNQIEGLKDKYFMILNTKAIQEQQAIIESQATEIDQLKSLITDLTNRLTILENK